MDLLGVGLLTIGVGVALIVVAFIAELVRPSGAGPRARHREASKAAKNPIAAILEAAAETLKQLGALLEGVLGKFPTPYRPGVFLVIVGALLAVVGTFA